MVIESHLVKLKKFQMAEYLVQIVIKLVKLFLLNYQILMVKLNQF